MKGVDDTKKQDVLEAFGKNAQSYVNSVVHAKGASLQRLVELVEPAADWHMLDIATGAGHTAFVFAPHVRQVTATDITPEMLEQTKMGAAERGLNNLITGHAEADHLPYPDNYFDLVTCRIAPHHFPDIRAFVIEAARVLKPGGTFAVVDNIVPQGTAGAYVNAFEKLRDRSHVRCWPFDTWRATIEEAGLRWIAGESLRKQMTFAFWAQRHDADTQSFLSAMLELADGEARVFLAPAETEKGLIFHLEEGLFIARKKDN